MLAVESIFGRGFDRATRPAAGGANRDRAPRDLWLAWTSTGCPSAPAAIRCASMGKSSRRSRRGWHIGRRRPCTTQRSSSFFQMGGSSSNKHRHIETEPSAALSVRDQSLPALRHDFGCFATRSGVGEMVSSLTLTRPSTVRGDLVMTRRWPAVSSSRLIACRRLSGDVMSSRQARCGTRTRSSLGRSFVPVFMPRKFVRPVADARQVGTPASSPLGESVSRVG